MLIFAPDINQKTRAQQVAKTPTKMRRELIMLQSGENIPTRGVCDFSLSRKNKTDTSPKGETSAEKEKESCTFSRCTHTRVRHKTKREVSGEPKIYVLRADK